MGTKLQENMSISEEIEEVEHALGDGFPLHKDHAEFQRYVSEP